MDIVFEEMREEHLEEVRAIYGYYVLNTTVTFQIREPTLRDMRELVFFEDVKYRAYAIKDSGALCGYVILSRFGKREAYGETAEVAVYLKPGHTGKGIGLAALRFIEDFAAARGMHVLIASICGENSQSIKLFEKAGYFKCAHLKEVGIKFGRRLDVVYYQKILPLEAAPH